MSEPNVWPFIFDEHRRFNRTAENRSHLKYVEIFRAERSDEGSGSEIDDESEIDGGEEGCTSDTEDSENEDDSFESDQAVHEAVVALRQLRTDPEEEEGNAPCAGQIDAVADFVKHTISSSTETHSGEKPPLIALFFKKTSAADGEAGASQKREKSDVSFLTAPRLRESLARPVCTNIPNTVVTFGLTIYFVSQRFIDTSDIEIEGSENGRPETNIRHM
jgi:hypothetical protein